MKFKKIPFRLTIISMCTLLALVLLVITFSFLVYFDGMMIENDIRNRFARMCDGVEATVNALDENMADTLRALAVFPTVMDGDKEGGGKAFNEIFTAIIRGNRQLYSMYIGHEDGEFHEIINLDVHGELRRTYNAKMTDRWLEVAIRQTGDGAVKTFSLLDDNLRRTAETSMPSDYIPGTRPWYRLAMSSQDPVKTTPYRFANIDGSGVTYALKLGPGRSVLAIDVLLADLGKMLAPFQETASTRAYIWGQNGELLAGTDNADKGDDLFAELVWASEGGVNSKQHFVKRIGGEEYLFHFKRVISLRGANCFLGAAAPYSDVVSEYRDRSYKLLIACVASFLLLLPLLRYLVSLIERPIASIKKESDKVGRREYDSMRPVSSIVLELDELSKSLFSMSRSIRSYENGLEEKIRERTRELAEKNDLLRHLSITDKLTGLRNRVHLDQVLEDELRRSRRAGRPFGIIIVDIDHFKEVNDTYGHQVGDTVLKEFAELISTFIRATDTAGRWGGEEFLVICPDTDQEGIAVLARKLCRKVAESSFSVIGAKTASFGVAVFEEHDKAEDLISRADQALYQAKGNGRNQVCES